MTPVRVHMASMVSIAASVHYNGHTLLWRVYSEHMDSLSPCTPSVLAHVWAAAQHTKGPGEGEYRPAEVVIIKYSVSQ